MECYLSFPDFIKDILTINHQGSLIHLGHVRMGHPFVPELVLLDKYNGNALIIQKEERKKKKSTSDPSKDLSPN